MLKTNLNELFETDKNSEEDGVWIDIDTGTRIKIRAYSAKAVSDLRENLMRPFNMLQRAGGKIPDDKSEEIGLRVVAGAVIADWSGIKGVQGEGEEAREVEIPYSEENAYTLLKDMPRFANFIIGISMDGQNYKDALREEGAKN